MPAKWVISLPWPWSSCMSRPRLYLHRCAQPSIVQPLVVMTMWASRPSYANLLLSSVLVCISSSKSYAHGPLRLAMRPSGHCFPGRPLSPVYLLIYLVGDDHVIDHVREKPSACPGTLLRCRLPVLPLKVDNCSECPSPPERCSACRREGTVRRIL